mmetsp:Transcript_25937/g.78874  ORF Transcript_25937/g.78874 Transcript_25937/m.78874 type:complete len:343 (-) Transcript_25937:2324-3352(-)
MRADARRGSISADMRRGSSSASTRAAREALSATPGSLLESSDDAPVASIKRGRRAVRALCRWYSRSPRTRRESISASSSDISLIHLQVSSPTTLPSGPRNGRSRIKRRPWSAPGCWPSAGPPKIMYSRLSRSRPMGSCLKRPMRPASTTKSSSSCLRSSSLRMRIWSRSPRFTCCAALFTCSERLRRRSTSRFRFRPPSLPSLSSADGSVPRTSSSAASASSPSSPSPLPSPSASPSSPSASHAFPPSPLLAPRTFGADSRAPVRSCESLSGRAMLYFAANFACSSASICALRFLYSVRFKSWSLSYAFVVASKNLEHNVVSESSWTTHSVIRHRISIPREE